MSVATPRTSQPIVAAMGAEYMTLPLEESPEGTVALDALDRVLEFEQDVIAAGPGLGTGHDVTAFVHGLLSKSESPLRSEFA